MNTMKKVMTAAPSRLNRASGLKQQASIYRDNASEILSVVVDASAATETLHRQLKQITIALCPFLVNEFEGNDPLGIDNIDVDAKMDMPDGNTLHTNDDDDDNPLKEVNDLNGVLESLEVKPLLGGLSNELFIVQQCVTSIRSSSSCSGSSSSSNASNNDEDDDNNDDNSNYNNNHTRAVLVRIHPAENSDGCEIVNREAENKLVAWLSLATNFAPAYYGRFVNGRVEEFYERHVTLSHHDMPDYAAEVASLLQKMHACQPPASVLPNHGGGGDIWRAVDRWLGMISPDNNDNDVSPSSLGDFDLQELKTEWNWLQSVLKKGHAKPRVHTSGEKEDASTAIANQAIAFANEIVLTHMDGQSLNLLRPDDSHSSHPSQTCETDTETEMKPLRLIDFEYAGWNPRAVDIANTFCEFCNMNNLKADYAKEYPSVQVQAVFLRSYLAGLESASPLGGLTVNEQTLFISALQQEIGRYTLVSHVGWTVWSLVQHRLSDIDFDYIAYANHRMLGYHYFKQRFY
jgi:thiamine kinase-like enzyme